tara:strand:+ start:2721 stop:3584 length:864 start_codon:yes stop_codon:yes gene_type:complete
LAKLKDLKPLNGLFLFFTCSILLILTLQYVDLITNLFFQFSNENKDETNNSIFPLLIFSISLITLFLFTDFYRTKLNISRTKIGKIFSLAILITTLNSFFIQSSLSILIQILIIDFGCLYFVFLISKSYSTNKILWLGIKKISNRDIRYFFYYFLAWPPIILWGTLINYYDLDFFNSDYSKTIIEMLNNNLILVFFLACIVAPVCEEIIFRGFVYKLVKSRYTIKHAIIINSILFGIIHFDPSAIVPATILGISLSIIRHKTENVICTIIMHSLHNIFALFMTSQAL